MFRCVYGVSLPARSTSASPIMMIQRWSVPDFGSEITTLHTISRMRGEEDTGEVWWYEYDYISNSVILRGDHFENNKLEPVKVKLEDGIVKAGPDEKPTTFRSAGEFSPDISSAISMTKRSSIIQMFR